MFGDNGSAVMIYLTFDVLTFLWKSVSNLILERVTIKITVVRSRIVATCIIYGNLFSL